jgi:NADH-quinone oxidoreductase subunit C
MTEAEAKTENTQPLEPARFGQFLAKAGIQSQRLPDSVNVETIELDGNALVNALQKLKDDQETKLDLLLTVSGVDSTDTFDSVYHLASYTNKNELVIKVRIAKASVKEGTLPAVPTVTGVFSAANWHERETYDLVGIHYIGHPYMRRILNPWDWEGHPLRRDYKQPVDALNDKNPVSMR